MARILDHIHSPQDMKNLNIDQLKVLSKEIREFLIGSISKTGGHLASNLGVVELTLALHYCFDSPKDQMIWDVGHQAYVHKVITGRKERFDTLRKLNGLSGFPKRKESEHDVFDTGHSSTSISAALGLAKARDLMGGNHSVIAIIGDGSLTGGLAFEALNNAGRANSNLIVVVNDNEMSISKNVGGLSKYLSDIRTEPVYLDVKEDVDSMLQRIPGIGKKVAKTVEKAKDSIKYFFVPGMLFEELGFTYVGPIDGHDLPNLINVLGKVKKMKGPILLHVHTKKGKGYKHAEIMPACYHGVSTFDVETGKAIAKKEEEAYSDVFGETMVRLAKVHPKLLAITAAMPSGTGLEAFEKQYPSRFFDVGIAEEHAVTFAAGLAVGGYKPVFAVYSSFLQRAYDQVLHDVCIQKLPVVFAIDRAGIVGADGETHQGIFDLSYLSHMPFMTILAPKNKQELVQMIEFAIAYREGPIAIRYPRGQASTCLEDHKEPIAYGKSEIIHKGKNIGIVAVGTMVEKAETVVQRLKKFGIYPTLMNGRFIQPLDEQALIELAKTHQWIFTMEDNIRSGGFGSKVVECLIDHGMNHVNIHHFAFPNEFIEHGSCKELYEKYQMDEDQMVEKIISFVHEIGEISNG